MTKYNYDSSLSSVDEILNVRRLSGRINSKAAARILGFEVHDIAVLVSLGLLRPLAKPVQNATKYFAACEIESLARSVTWLGKATQAVYDRWRIKNSVKARKDSHGDSIRCFPQEQEISKAGISENSFSE